MSYFGAMSAEGRCRTARPHAPLVRRTRQPPQPRRQVIWPRPLQRQADVAYDEAVGVVAVLRQPADQRAATDPHHLVAQRLRTRHASLAKKVGVGLGLVGQQHRSGIDSDSNYCRAGTCGMTWLTR
jgi:hypothetical protein